MILKYIIVRDRDEVESAILFPERVIHRDVARIHRASDVRVVSAGFVQIGHMDGESICATFGDSESLRMKPRPEDAEVISKDFEK